MAQPQMARITCVECNAWYNSERELRDHMRTVHRRFGLDQSSSRSVAAQLDGSTSQPRKQEDTLISKR
jgi:hypothetical protein